MNKANSSNIDCSFLEFANGIVSSITYDEWDDLNFETVIFPFLDGDGPRSP